MNFFKKLFDKSDKPKVEPLRNVSAAPMQTQEEQDATRQRMEAEMDVSRAERDSRSSNP
jgi:hypothetical protein